MHSTVICLPAIDVLTITRHVLLAGAESRQTNSCHLIWQGTVKDKTFRRFDLEVCRTEVAAKAYLKPKGLDQYWDLAKGHVKEDA